MKKNLTMHKLLDKHSWMSSKDGSYQVCSVCREKRKAPRPTYKDLIGDLSSLTGGGGWGGSLTLDKMNEAIDALKDAGAKLESSTKIIGPSSVTQKDLFSLPV